MQHETQSLVDGVEAMRNFIDAEHWDDTAQVARNLVETLARFGQTIAVASVACEVLKALPDTHAEFALLCDAEAKAHLALGFSDRARQRYESLLARFERLAKAEPDRADYQRDFSVSYERVGDLYRALG